MAIKIRGKGGQQFFENELSMGRKLVRWNPSFKLEKQNTKSPLGEKQPAVWTLKKKKTRRVTSPGIKKINRKFGPARVKYKVMGGGLLPDYFTRGLEAKSSLHIRKSLYREHKRGK